MVIFGQTSYNYIVTHMNHKLIIVSVAILLVIIGGFYWHERLAVRNDEQRLRDVEDVMQILIEMRTNQPEWFAQIVGRAAAGQVMIGRGSDCAGDFGSACADPGLSDTCLDLTQPFSNYMDSLLVDPDRDQFSIEQTGYYLLVSDGMLEVGACQSEAREEIKLEYAL